MEYRIDSSESLLPPSEARAAAPFNLILKLLQRYFFYVSYYFFYNIPWPPPFMGHWAGHSRWRIKRTSPRPRPTRRRWPKNISLKTAIVTASFKGEEEQWAPSSTAERKEEHLILPLKKRGEERKLAYYFIVLRSVVDYENRPSLWDRASCSHPFLIPPESSPHGRGVGTSSSVCARTNCRLD